MVQFAKTQQPGLSTPSDEAEALRQAKEEKLGALVNQIGVQDLHPGGNVLELNRRHIFYQRKQTPGSHQSVEVTLLLT